MSVIELSVLVKVLTSESFGFLFRHIAIFNSTTSADCQLVRYLKWLRDEFPCAPIMTYWFIWTIYANPNPISKCNSSPKPNFERNPTSKDISKLNPRPKANSKRNPRLSLSLNATLGLSLFINATLGLNLSLNATLARRLSLNATLRLRNIFHQHIVTFNSTTSADCQLVRYLGTRWVSLCTNNDLLNHFLRSCTTA